ncbi:PAS domain-containing sensor histidine kinase [Desulfosarcina ovata]|uniref:histidine kinase n=1 Tax=Desulfosarcina ovata subsp. ovata TaxID=2752305 RepID=A0A5K8A917_9BACT|nr:response regulator [Desulfosarcina ovata]BBO89035.1 hypothetical protein DSCOOX_22150 [Desulfosarcina ovata subsp. ovata]
MLELDVAASLMVEPLLKEDFQIVDQFIINWAISNNLVLKFYAKNPKGHIFSSYNRDATSSLHISVSKKVFHLNRHILTLYITKDCSGIEKIIAEIKKILIVSSILILSALSGGLWIIFRFLTIKPLEKEIDRRLKAEEKLAAVNNELDDKVKQRTQELSNKNIELINEIQQRENAEEEVLAQSERFRVFFDSINDAIFIQPFKEKSLAPFVEINKISCERYGYTREELLFLSMHDITDESCYEEFEHNINRLELSETKHLIFEAVHIKKSGETFPVEINANIVFQHEEPFILTVARDITERKYVEIEKHALKEQLIQSQKLEAIGTLAGGIAHDFNNILSAVIGYTEIALDDDLSADTPARDSLENVLKAGLRAKDLVKQILAFSRQTQFEKKPIILSPIVKEVLKLMRASLPANIEIRHHISADNCTISGNPIQIHQVLMNLCVNAGYAMRNSGGSLEVALSAVDYDQIAPLIQADLTPRPYVALTVTDIGPGMPASVLKQIFDPFFTTKPKEEGTGLGLSVVHGIVKEHEGAIHAASQLDEGTTFSVYLPLLVEAKEGGAEAAGPLPTGNERILAVDDEKAIASTLQQILKRLGYTVMTVSSGREALHLFSKDPDRFDLVITDQTMPLMTGDQLAMKILELRPNIPIILCTGFSHVMDEAHAKKIGVREYIMKPVTSRDLSEAVRRVLDQR